MPQTPHSNSDGWEPTEPSLFSSPEEASGEAPALDVEPGWQAVRSLAQMKSDELLSVMLRPSFRPVRDLDVVPIAPCPYCLDGGLRTAGSVRTRNGREMVRACDTCGRVDVGEHLWPPAKQG